MDDESLEDTYDWLDDDEHYPLDSTHVFGWKEWVGDGAIHTESNWLIPYCEEHSNVVRSQKTALTTSSDEEKREWITENRPKLVKECEGSLNKARHQSIQQQTPGRMMNPTWPSPPTMPQP